MRLFALTGSIGSGKSAVSEILSQRGAHIIDADLLAREVVHPGTQGLSDVIQRFGAGICNQDGTLNRKSLGDLIFADQKARHDLESILHPLIAKRLAQELMRLGSDLPAHAIVVYVVPLLFEARVDYPAFEEVLIVEAPLETALSRVMKRDGCSREAALARVHAQLPAEQKKSRANVIFDNSAGLDRLRSQVELWYDARSAEAHSAFIA